MNELFLIKINERFVKDYNLSIQPEIAKTEYFMDRLKQYDKYKPGTLEKYNLFKKEITSNFKNVEEYYEYRNNLANKIISSLEVSQEKIGFLNKDALKNFKPLKIDISRKSYLKETSLGKTLISIDLKSAGFQALKFFDEALVNGAKDYEEFISSFTNYETIINSKYFRQRCFGSAGISHQVELEKYLTGKILEYLLTIIPFENFITYSHDEIVFEKPSNFEKIYPLIKEKINELNLVVHVEEFILKRIEGTREGYLKIGKDLIEDKHINKIYAVPSILFPFAISNILDEPIIDSYSYFYNNEGYLSKFVEIPKISIIN